MNNVRTIVKTDAKRLTGSVVGLVVMIGLCVLPCLYAWFNIFSNWDPYGPESTSRIPVAVASEDRGTTLLGLELNVGDMLLEGLAANDQLGWVFTDSRQEAVARVEQGDCYAALVVPEDFSAGILSFLSLEFEHPRILYYENGKINAIAPKITAKARTAVQEQVNAAFLKTLVGDAAKLASVLSAGGLDPEESLKEVSSRLTDLQSRLGEAESALDEASGLSGAASGLLLDSDSLLQSAGTALSCSQEMLGLLSAGIPRTDAGPVLSDLTALTQDVTGELTGLSGELDAALDGAAAFNAFLEQARDQRVSRLREQSARAGTVSEAAAALGLDLIAGRLRQLEQGLSDLAAALALWQPLLDDGAVAEQQDRLAAATAAAQQTGQLLALTAQLTSDAAAVLRESGDPLAEQAAQAASDAAELMSLLQGRAGAAETALDSAAGDLDELAAALDRTRSALTRTRAELSRQAAFLSALADSAFLQNALDLLSRQGGLLSGYVASPLQVEEQVYYEVESYGSQMAPFYTVLALWVGALFAAALLKIRLRPEDRPAGLTAGQHYLGRGCLFAAVALIQSLITALGDLLYVEIDCVHPGLFLLAVVVIGLSFALINYTLSFTMGSVGLGLSVIIMVIQVAGSGGTYPVEVLPRLFRVLYPVMPFRYAMDALREAVCGCYGHYYLKDLLCLLATAAGVALLCLLLYRPARALNGLIEKGKEKSGLMV